MKSLRYTLIVSLLTFLYSVTEVCACTYMSYLPSGYYMYRVVEKPTQKDSVFSQFNPNAENNCREWQQYTSKAIPLTDIYQVVYKMPLQEFMVFHENPWSYSGDNAFLSWISRHPRGVYEYEISDFLLLAKITETVRSHRNSRWYYPSMRTGTEMTLEEIAEKALNYRGPLRDRYMLQAVRALRSLNRIADCIALWDNEASMLPKESTMRQLILPYIAGAEYLMGHYDKAVSYSHEAGDFKAMISYTGPEMPKSICETIERIYAYEPNCRFFPRMLQEFIREAENDEMYYWENTEPNIDLITDEHRRLSRLAVRIAQEGKTDNPAMWYYTAAFIEDLQNHTVEASRLLTKAEQSRGTGFIKESVNVMRMYLDAKLLPYNRFYEYRLYEQLQWLDQKIADNITPDVRRKTAEQWDLFCNTSYYYYNDMMRRIILAEVCPRMIKSGKPIRALQLANMADNRLLGLVDCCTYYKNKFIKGRDEWIETKCSMREFRRDKDAWTPDYSNSFFEMIDSLGVDRAIAYRNRIERPVDTFDRFLNERGYVDMEYINDIVGTQCLRTMRYGDAVAYLGQISRSFEGHLNTEIGYDPFSYERRKIDDKSDFKYRFAREMWFLEQEIEKTTEPNRRAESMLRYAIGLRNSFDRCWALTQYYLGTTYFGQVQYKRDWSSEQETVLAINRSSELLLKACSLFTDRELAAKALYRLNQLRTVVNIYPETETGRYVMGHCDNLRDYMPTPEYWGLLR